MSEVQGEVLEAIGAERDSVTVEVSRGMAGKYSWSVKVKAYSDEGEGEGIGRSVAEQTRRLVEHIEDQLRQKYGEAGS